MSFQAPKGREAIGRAVVNDGLTKAEAARRYNTTPNTVTKWVERYRKEGVKGLRRLLGHFYLRSMHSDAVAFINRRLVVAPRKDAVWLSIIVQKKDDHLRSDSMAR